jgi:hypothetical protein
MGEIGSMDEVAGPDPSRPVSGGCPLGSADELLAPKDLS